MAETSSPSPASSGKESTESTASQRVHSEQTRLSHTVTPRETIVPTADSSDDDADRGQSLCGGEPFTNGTEQGPRDEATDVERSLADSSEYSKSLNHSLSNSGTTTNLNSDTSGAASSSSAANAKDVLSKYAVSHSASITRDSTSLSLSRTANGHLHTEPLETESPNLHQPCASKRPRLSPNANNTRPETKSSAIGPSIEAPAAGRSSVQSVAVTISVEDQVQEKSHLPTVRQKNDNVKLLKAKSDVDHNVDVVTSAGPKSIVSTKQEPPLSGSPSAKPSGTVNVAPASSIQFPHPGVQSNPASSTANDSTVPLLVAYQSDPLVYDGDALLRRMVDRCMECFGSSVDRMPLWVGYLNMTRTGSNDAFTIAQKLCELSGNDEKFCQNLPEDVALLCEYTGGASSIWEFFKVESRPSPAAAAPDSKTPQKSCLTCLAMNRDCRGSSLEHGRCTACCKTVTGTYRRVPDDCYWSQEKLGIRTYQDACDYYGTVAKAASAAHGHKRKHADTYTPMVSKRTKVKPLQLNGLYPNAGSWGYPVTFVHIMRHAIYADGTYAQIGHTRFTINVGLFKTLRHAMIYTLKSVLDSKTALRQTFTTKPDYIFKVRNAEGQGREMNEWDFVHFDRSIARGKGFPGAEAVIEARAPRTPRQKSR